MKKEKLAVALNEISDKHIDEAATAKKKRRGLTRLAAIAAVLAVVLLVRNIEIPLFVTAKAVSLAPEARLTDRPDFEDYSDREAWMKDLDAWTAQRDARDATASEALDAMKPFLQQSCASFLDGSENALYSPINAYIGLAMTAELASGNSRQQLLDTLGAADTDVLRRYTAALWENVYRNDGNEISTLANSLWLDKELRYTQAVMDDLAYHYYTDIYQRDLSAGGAAKDIGNWIANNTGGFLKSDAIKVQLPEDPILALYSTIYFQAKWQNEFSAANNTEGIFHGTAGDLECTFMNAKLRKMHYYWSDSFGAVSLGLKNGSSMWLILPDEDKSIDDILREGEYWNMVTAPYDGWENTRYLKVNLSVPKFDISTYTDLRDGLQRMGITDIFTFKTADFSEALEGLACITAANQSVRVAIDEKGVTAAAYIELPAAGEAPPPEEIIDFILDRPFLFIIADNSGIPLFAGAVNQP